MCLVNSVTSQSHRFKVKGWPFTVVSNSVTRGGCTRKKTVWIVSIVWDDGPVDCYRFDTDPDIGYWVPRELILTQCKEEGRFVTLKQAAKVFGSGCVPNI